MGAEEFFSVEVDEMVGRFCNPDLSFPCDILGELAEGSAVERDVVNHAIEYVNGHVHTNGI